MLGIILVGTGSFIGGVCRYLHSSWVRRMHGEAEPQRAAPLFTKKSQRLSNRLAED